MKWHFLILLAFSTAAFGEARWIEGVLVNQKDGEPLLYVEYDEPLGGLPGEYYWLSPAPEVGDKLTAILRKQKLAGKLRVLARFEPDYEGHISRDLNGFLIEAEVIDIDTKFK